MLNPAPLPRGLLTRLLTYRSPRLGRGEAKGGSWATAHWSREVEAGEPANGSLAAGPDVQRTCALQPRAALVLIHHLQRLSGHHEGSRPARDSGRRLKPLVQEPGGQEVRSPSLLLPPVVLGRWPQDREEGRARGLCSSHACVLSPPPVSPVLTTLVPLRPSPELGPFHPRT